jgi:hypothetical protein
MVITTTESLLDFTSADHHTVFETRNSTSIWLMRLLDDYLHLHQISGVAISINNASRGGVVPELSDEPAGHVY